MIGVSQGITKAVKKVKLKFKKVLDYIFSTRDKNWNGTEETWDA